MRIMDTSRTSSVRIGLFIRERRLASHLTQRQLGELAGVGTRFVSELERGKTTLRIARHQAASSVASDAAAADRTSKFGSFRMAWSMG